MATRSRRRPTNAPRPELSRKDPAPKKQPAAASTSPYAGTGIPEWHWKTTPVLFMFALGGLIGAFAGAAAAGANEFAFLVIMGTFAMIFGLSAGRILRRWLAIRKIQKLRAG